MDGSGSHWPIVLIEIVLVFGGVLAFGWWQLRSVEKDRREMQQRREREAEATRQDARQADDPPG